jgi:hypothetical protein
MTDQNHPDQNHPDQNHPDQHSPSDPIAAALGEAAERLRSQAPDEVASRQALAWVNERTHAPAPRQRPWWPALIGAGLAAAAIVGVIAIRSGDRDTLTPATEPPSTSTPASISSIEPSTTLAPSTTGNGPSGASLVVDGGCITVTTPAGSATGCPTQSTELDHLERRTFVADLDGPVVVTSASSDPLAGLTVTVEAGGLPAPCRWDDLAPRIPDGGLVEVVVCNDTGVMGMTTGRYPDERPRISYFTLPTPYLPEGADLGLGTPVPGLPHAVAFTTSVQDIVTCSLLLLPDRSGWKETCGEIHGLDLATALVQLDPADPTVHEITVDGTGLITSARALDAMAPSSGCSIESANDLARGVFASSIVMGIGCIDDKASLTTGAVLTQDGPPDGSIWLALRENGAWSITDSGTGIDNSFSFPIAPFDTWSTWPDSTVPGFRSYWWEPIIAIPSQPTVDAFAAELLRTLGTLGFDPEFPLNERLVAVQPGGLALIVAQVDLGGDDSVSGGVIYVWLEQAFDDNGPTGWRASAVLAGAVCARGTDSSASELCI